jgi:anthranilate phosphoribosyltransferase
MSLDLRELLERLLGGHALAESEAGALMRALTDPEVPPAMSGALLAALRAKGITADEVRGFAGAMRALARRPELPEGLAAIDVVGTGGDGSHTINVSTIAALVAAGAGVPVCKHGNRSASSKCGAADVLEQLGVVVEQTPDQVAASIRRNGIGFCFAPVFHPAFRYAGPPRREMGIATAFNLLGPMANPGRVERQLIGVAEPRFAMAIVGALRERGLARAWVVHGGGYDELTTTGTSIVTALDGGVIEEFTVDPRTYGLPLANESDLAGDDPAANAEAARRVLAGEPGAHRDIVLLNAAAALVVAGRADDLASGLEIAADAIDDGSAARALEGLIASSRSAPG